MARIVSTGSTLASENFLEKKRRVRRKKLLVSITVFLVLAGFIIFFLRADTLRIVEVNVFGNEAVSSASVISVVADELSGYYFWLIPRDSTFFYSEKGMKETLFHKFPRFNSIETSLVGLQTLELVVSEREPIALYCDSVAASSCYFLDETGLIFDIAPTFSEGVYFTYSLGTPLEFPLGKEFVPREEFWELDGFVRNLLNLGIEAKALEISSRKYTLILSTDAKIIWNKDSNFSLIYSNLEAFLNSEEIATQENFLDTLKEMDLSIENKIHWTTQ